MVRNESDKEDLITDASALIHRAEFSAAVDRDRPSAWKLVTVGFRKDNSLSLYFDQDPFYQFDADGKLRRALEDGFLYRSTGTTLAKLHRLRTEQRTVLQREDLSDSQLSDFRQRMAQHVTRFSDALTTNSIQLRRIVSSDANLTAKLKHALRQVLAAGDGFLSDSIRSRR